MRWRENIPFIISVGVIVSMIPVISSCGNTQRALQSAQERPQTQKEKIAELKESFPIVDYNEAAPSDSALLQRRRARGAKYDKPEVTVDLTSELVVGSEHWGLDLPAFPLQQSTAVVLGSVTDARARLSNNKKGVYSEFTLQIEDVLKNDAAKSLTSETEVVVDREGGRVRLPSGKLGMYYITGQRMPVVNRRYVLFLSGEASTGFTIVTGYELSGGKVAPLDRPGSGHPFTSYDGADEKSFLEELRGAVANPPPPK